MLRHQQEVGRNCMQCVSKISATYLLISPHQLWLGAMHLHTDTVKYGFTLVRAMHTTSFGQQKCVITASQFQPVCKLQMKSV